MNRVMAVAVAASMWLGCGNDKLVSTGGAGDEPTAATGTAGPATRTDGLQVELRMRGDSVGEFTSLKLIPNGVTVIADGRPLLVRPTFRAVELATEGHAEHLATFTLPEGVQNVHFKVDLGAAGGFQTAQSSGWVDTSKGVMEFDARGSELSKTRRAVVIVDASRSFAPRDETTVVMVPNFRVD